MKIYGRDPQVNWNGNLFLFPDRFLFVRWVGG